MSPDAAASAPLAVVLLIRTAGASFAIAQEAVAEILPLPHLAALPEAPPIVRGAFHLGRTVVLVLALRDLLGLEGAAEGDPLYHHLLLMQRRPGRARLALLVDRVTAVEARPVELLPPGESFNDCVEGDVRIGETVVPLISAARLLAAREEERLAAFAARAAAREAAFAEPRP